MPELDPFDARLTTAVRAFADRAETGVDAVAVAGRAMGRRRAGAFAWLGHPLPVPAWIVLLVGLLLAGLFGSAVMVGVLRDDRVSVVPAVSPGPSAMASEIAGIDLLRVRAHALPPAATCPAGATADASGSTDLTRWPSGVGGPDEMAFDRQSGRIVALEVNYGSAARTWAFDVCANRWTPGRLAPFVEMLALVYDADSDRTIALASSDASAGPVATWSYNTEADRWVRGADGPVFATVAGSGNTWTNVKAAYHDPSGLVVAYDGTRLWAYDVEADRWSAIRETADPELPSGVLATTFSYDPAQDAFVTYAFLSWDGPQATLTFDPSTGAWRRGPGIGISGLMCSWVQTIGCTAAYDPTTGMTVWIDRISGSIEGWDSSKDAWELLYRPKTADEVAMCTAFDGSAYDSFHGRIVCSGKAGGVAAFTPATRTWQWLLAPAGTASPSPSAGDAGASNVLATTRAHPLPPAATCASGADPVRPGPADQARPALSWAATAFDRRAGRVVAVNPVYGAVGSSSGATWTFDVCTNTWAIGSEGPQAALAAAAVLVYDADSDRTIALVGRGQLVDRVTAWSYDLASDRWTRGSDSPVPSPMSLYEGHSFVGAYHDPSGLVVVYDGTGLLAYDVESDAWTAVPWVDDGARPVGVLATTATYDSARDRLVVNVDDVTAEHLTLAIDPVTGQVESRGSGIEWHCGAWFGVCGDLFDEATGRSLWTDGADLVKAWNPESGTWEALSDASGDARTGQAWCEESRPAADSLNDRIVCTGKDGRVAAFTPATGRWQWLVEPEQ
jgi:hypothetical protein